ncbi:MAG: hypothetical protein OEQ18_04805 [Gammaproteobacteria bacterium]|nr:hypothetical protein [Gammaproteobacteria bacterium]
MKKFKIIGPDTEREFEIADDEMVTWKVVKIPPDENPDENRQ